MTLPTTSLATVTFEGDLRLTVLQALSIDRLLDLDGVDEFVVVLNGANNIALEAELRRHITGRISEHLQGKLRVIATPDLPRGGDGRGWYGQQTIKLALCDVVESEAYLMLDAKNHFIRPSSIDDFFHEGKPITQLTPTTPNWTKYVRASLLALGVFTEDRLSKMMPTVTPYLMLTDEVTNTVSRLEQRFDLPLDRAFRKTGGATEFFLYYAHLVSTYDEIQYANRPSLTRTLFTQWPQDHGKVLDMIADAVEKNVPMFGLHRNRLPQLSRSQMDAIKEMWGRHLLKDWEDADWFFAY
jgi:hypothetical protein